MGAEPGVLIVDDDEDIRFLVRNLIEETPGLCVAGAAADVDQALALLDESAPQVVLLDSILPRIDGVAGARMIAERHPGLKIVLCSAKHPEEIEADARAAHVDAWLNKGDLERIPAALLEILAGGEAGAAD